MTAKTVALDEEAYALLVRSKRAGETFSEVVLRELRPATRISDLAGSLSDVSAREWDAVRRERAAHRRHDSARRERVERGGDRP